MAPSKIYLHVLCLLDGWALLIKQSSHTKKPQNLIVSFITNLKADGGDGADPPLGQLHLHLTAVMADQPVRQSLPLPPVLWGC